MLNIVGHMGNASSNYIEIYCTPTRIVKILNIDNTKYWRECGTTKILFIAGGNAKSINHFGKECNNLL